MKHFKRSLDVEVVIFPQSITTSAAAQKLGFPLRLYAGNQVLGGQIQKDMFSAIGGFSVDLRSPAGVDWEDIISNGDLAFISVDGKPKMQGLVTSVGYGSQLQNGKVSDTASIKVMDLGMMFSKFGKFITDPAWRVKQAEIGLNFQNAYRAIKSQYNYSSYDLKKIFELTWKEIVGAFIKTTEQVGLPFIFSNGATFDNFFTGLFDGVSDQFDSNYPMTVHILQENFPDVWALWQKISNPPFNELWCNTVYAGQEIGIFKQTADIKTVESDGFMVFCRPSVWFRDRFDILRRKANDISDIKFTQINATKSSSEIKSMYLVYPEGGISPQSMKANGDFAVDTNFLSKWGIDYQEVPLNFFSREKDSIEYAAGMADIMKEAYKDIDKYYSGAALLNYHDVRVGQVVRMPKKLRSSQKIHALVTGVTDQFKVPASAHTQLTFVRGEVDTGLPV